MSPLHRVGRLLALLAVFTGLVLVAPPAPAVQARQASPQPKWAAWALSVDFSGGTMKVLYKAYIATYDTPPLIIGWYDKDITASCATNTGAPIQYAGDYAIFDGSYYITCTVPSWRDAIRSLDPTMWPAPGASFIATVGDGPVWAAADLVLSQVTANNPVVDAGDLGIVFSVPRSGGTAQSAITLSGGTLASSNWNVDNQAGNQVLLGTYGAAIQAFHDKFGWLGCLHDPNWRRFFSNGANGLDYGHWVEQPTRKGVRAASFASYRLAAGGGNISIGYSPSTGSYFYGKMRSIRLDPGSKGI